MKGWDEQHSLACILPTCKMGKKTYSPGGFEAKIGFAKQFGVKDTEEKHRKSFIYYNPQLLVKERDTVKSPVGQISAQMPEQPKEEVENKKHMLDIFVPVIKHLLEQAESKCTADKENITMSQKPDSF